MANRKKKTVPFHMPKWAGGILAVAVLVLGALGYGRGMQGEEGNLIAAFLNAVDQLLYGESRPMPPSLPSNGQVKVSVIDVGQGESILVTTDTKSLLIDAGENDKGDEVIDFLTQVGVKKLDYVIATHPHSDHIGGMDTVLRQIPTDQVLFGKVPDSLLPTTKTYNDLLDVIASKHIALKEVSPGEIYELGSGAKLTILGPNGSYQDLNNCSVVCRLDFGKTAFLFNGDQEAMAEKDLLESGANLRADAMTMGHHGSSTSSSSAYFAAVHPSFATISCGKGNKYNHPHKESLERLDDSGIFYYRTDLNGNLTYTSNGNKITLEGSK